ncbi:uncharacterized protein LOC142338702 [Convolutriloba macropyga]|uniref:uncharacterized protein LOC142338702 n=1 Tax=Convolutriloba macropyga TaxID=536237 RepID=UPI003F51AE1C
MNEVSKKHRCHQCGNSSNDLFHCETCNCISNETSTATVKELLCEVCIASHVVCNHVTTDEKRNEPLICQEHKMLEQEFCRTCDTTFCWKCMSKHSKHDFDTINKRGSELRSEVFELLSALELAEKPLPMKKDKLSEMVEKHKKEQSNLRQLIETEIEKLRKTCLAVIDENCDILSADYESVTQLADETTEMQQKIRNLLASSNAHLLKQFAVAQNQVLNINAAVKELAENGDLVVETCQMHEIPVMFHNCGEYLKKFMKSTRKAQKPTIDYKSSSCHGPPNEFILSDRSNIVHRIVVKNGLLCIDHADVGNLGTLNSELQFYGREETDFRENVERCFMLYVWGKYSNRILLISDTNTHYAIEPEEKLKVNKVSPPPHKHPLCPYSYSSSNCEKIEWSYWDEQSNMIKFTHTDQFTIACDKVPAVRQNDICHIMSLCFITEHNNIILADAHNCKFWIIPVNISHKKISCVTTNSNVVIIWCCEDETVFIAIRERGQFSLPVNYKWDTKSLYTHVDVNAHICITVRSPKIRNTDN